MPKLSSSQLALWLGLIVYLGVFVFQFGLSVSYVLFILGVLFGLSFFWWEMVFHIQTNPQFLTLKQQFEQLLHKRQISEIIKIFQSESERVSTVSRSYVFVGIYFLIAFFVITSTGSAIGVGMVLGLGLRYCLDIHQYWTRPEQLDHIYGRYLHIHLKREFLPFLRILYLLFFGLFSLMVLG